MSSSTTTSTCPLLSLPAELRLQIYAHALHPTSVLTLSSTKTHRFAVHPKITPSLLSTNRQIHHEAQSLLYSENTVTLTIDAHETYWPPVSESRLPQPILEKIQRLCVIFDCTTLSHARYEDVDFGAFEALGALKTLRVSMIHATEDIWGGPGRDPVDRGVELFTQILMRVPRAVKVLCGVEKGSQEAGLLESVVDSRRYNRTQPHVIDVVETRDVEKAIAQVPEDIRGIKNGMNPDVYAEFRELSTQKGRTFAMV